MSNHSLLYSEIIDDLAELIHDAGLTADQLDTYADELIVIVPRDQRGMIIPPTDTHVMVLANDALSDYLCGEGWQAILTALRRLEDGASEGLDMPTPESE